MVFPSPSPFSPINIALSLENCCKLRRSIQNCLTHTSQTQQQLSRNFWALYWHHIWLEQSANQSQLARHHLSAYLQEACFWAAHKGAALHPSSQGSIADHFNTVWIKFDQVLQGFRSDQGTSLESYAATVFARAINVSLRQLGIADVCSDWGLLRKVSQKLLVETLAHAGHEQTAITRYIALWSCFKEIYTPTQPTATRQLPQPEPAVWQAISDVYNREHLQPNEPMCTGDNAERWIIASAKAARSYLYPATRSLDQPKPGQDETPLDLADPDTYPLLDTLILAEAQQERIVHLQQFHTVLYKALSTLNQEALRILRLYYHQGLPQQNIAQQLAIKQYTVSRRLTRSREKLLKILIDWSREHLHISLNLEQLDTMHEILEDWLRHYQNWPDSPEEHP